MLKRKPEDAVEMTHFFYSETPRQVQEEGIEKERERKRERERESEREREKQVIFCISLLPMERGSEDSINVARRPRESIRMAEI